MSPLQIPKFISDHTEGIVLGAILSIIIIISYQFLYVLAPVPYMPELINPKNGSSVEITPYTVLSWSGGTNDSLLSQVISWISHEPSGCIRTSYTIYISETDGPFVLEGDIDQLRPNVKEQMKINMPNSIKDNSTYRWKVIAFNNLGKMMPSPIWIFNTTFINMPPMITNLTPEPYSPQAPGAIITWTANAVDPNDDPIYYKFFHNGVEETGWTRSNRWNWVTSRSDAGDNSIEVWVKDGKHATKDYSKPNMWDREDRTYANKKNYSDDLKVEKFVIETKHKILDIQSSSEFSITNIWDNFNEEINKDDEFFYATMGDAAPITVRGTTQYPEDTKIWVVLTDSYKNYYVQNPPVFINPKGTWRATNIRPLDDIIFISFIKVDENGNESFADKVTRNDWRGVKVLPKNSKIVGSIEIL